VLRRCPPYFLLMLVVTHFFFSHSIVAMGIYSRLTISPVMPPLHTHTHTHKKKKKHI
jgi:hypothetical protein